MRWASGPERGLSTPVNLTHLAMKASAAQRTTGPRIEVPSAQHDRLKLGRVGVVAAVGFVIGVAWPRLAGVQLAPKPPRDESNEAPSKSDGSPLPPPSPKGAASASKPKEPRPEDRVAIGETQVTSCRDREGRVQRDCESLDLGALAESRLKALAACEGVQDAEGVLSLGLDLDFARNRVSGIQTGKSTTLPVRTARTLADCAEKEFSGIDLEGVEHQHAQYTVFYLLTFSAPKVEPAPDAEESGAGANEQTVGASGRATVSWNVALVREEPKDGAIVARLLSGTRVIVTGRRGNWCRIKYDAKGSEGWVYRTAIGL